MPFYLKSDTEEAAAMAVAATVVEMSESAEQTEAFRNTTMIIIEAEQWKCNEFRLIRANNTNGKQEWARSNSFQKFDCTSTSRVSVYTVMDLLSDKFFSLIRVAEFPIFLSLATTVKLSSKLSEFPSQNNKTF